MLNTKINENYNANDIVNPNDLRKRILNIDSRFRKDLSQSTTDYTYVLEHTYKNIIRIKVSSIEIPNMIYTFTESNNTFKVKAYDILNIVREVLIKIPVGNYSSFDLIAVIQSDLDIKLRNAYGIFFNISLDTASARVIIAHTGVSAYDSVTGYKVGADPKPEASAKPFILEFNTCNRIHHFGLGYNLGYRKHCYKVTTLKKETLDTYVIKGECCMDVVGDTYMFLCLNDFHTIEHKTDMNYIQCLAKIIIREDRYSVIYDDGSSLMSNEIVFPSPIDLKILQVKLLDSYGTVVDLNCMDFSFSLEITEVLNTSLFDFYRNYLWLGSIPSIKKASGSQQGLLRGIGPPF